MANRFTKYVDPMAANQQAAAAQAEALGGYNPHATFVETQPKTNRFAKYVAQEPLEQFGPPQPPAPKGFFERVSDKFAERDQELQRASDDPEFPGGETGLMFNALGQTLQKGLNDVPAEAMVSAGRAIPEPIKDFAGDVYSVAKNTPILGPTLRGTGYVLGQAAQGYDKFQRNHPTAGLYLDSTLGFGNAALSAVPVKGQSIPSRVLSPVEKGLNTKTVLPTIQAVKDKSQSLFKSGLSKGAAFTDDAVDEIINVAVKEKGTDAFGSSYLGKTPMDDIAERLTEARKNPMTLDSYEALDKEWGSLAHEAAVAGKDNLARQYEVLQAKLRDVAQNPNYIKGSSEGVADYQKAVKLWAIRSKMRDLEQINEYAKYYVGGEAAGIKAGYARLAKSNKIYKYSPKEVKMIQKAAKTGYTEGLMRTLGSRLMVIGGAIKGGPAGATAAYAASQGLRGGAATLKGIESGRIGKSIAKEAVKVSPELATKAQRIPTIELKKILKLPPKEAKAAMQQMKTQSAETKLLAPRDKMSAIPMTDEQIAISQAQINRPVKTGPDMSGAATKPPVSQLTKLRDNLGRVKGKDFENHVQIFKDGDMSQNQFIKDMTGKFGLTNSQARSLAKEINTYD